MASLRWHTCAQCALEGPAFYSSSSHSRRAMPSPGDAFAAFAFASSLVVAALAFATFAFAALAFGIFAVISQVVTTAQLLRREGVNLSSSQRCN